MPCEVSVTMPACDPVNDTASRRKQVSFIDYLLVGQSIMVQKGNPTHIKTLDDLSGKTVGAEVGTTNLDFIKQLSTKLKAKGSSITALRHLVAAQIAFNRLINALYKVKVVVDPAEIDKKYNEFANDPRLPFTLFAAFVHRGRREFFAHLG